MSRPTRRGATSATILLWVALCLVGFAIVAVWAVESKALPIQADIERRARAAVVGAPGLDLRVEADGRDVTIRGRVGNEGDHRAVISRLMAVDGVRVIDDALQVIPGLPTTTTPAVEGWGDATPTPDAPAAPAPGEDAATAGSDASGWGTAAPTPTPPRGDAWGTNRPVERTKRAERTKRTKRTKRTARTQAKTTRASAAPPAAEPTRTRRSTRRGAPTARDQIVFAPGSTGLGADGQAAVHAMARRASRGGTVHVYGHADDAGSEWGNHDLSLDRAHRVARALRGAGVSSVRVHGAGDQYPLGPAGSLRNRRVELALHGSRQ